MRECKKYITLTKKLKKCRAPYGYIKDPSDHNHLLIDERVAPVVRKMFDLALEGNGIAKIQCWLNTQNILHPAAYYKFVGSLHEFYIPVPKRDCRMAEKACVRCGAAFTPGSGVARYCPACREVVARENAVRSEERRKAKRSVAAGLG